MNAASSVFDEVGKISYIYIIYYLLPDIPELLPLDTVHASMSSRLHPAVVAMVASEDAAVDLDGGSYPHIIYSAHHCPPTSNTAVHWSRSSVW